MKSGQKYEKVVKSSKKWLKFGKVGKKWEKVEKVGKMAKSWKKCGKVRKSGKKYEIVVVNVCWGLKCLFVTVTDISVDHAMPDEINPFTALTRIRSQFLRTQ